MQLSLLSWNSHDIQDDTFESFVPPGQMSNLQSNGISIPRTNDWPLLSTSIIDGEQTFTFHIKIKSGEFSENREILKGWFAITDSQRHNLLAQNLIDDSIWYLTGIPVQFVELRVGLYAVTLQVEMKAWRMDEPLVETWNIAATGETKSFTVTGNIPSRPIISIKPTVIRTAGGTKFSTWKPILNQLSVTCQIPFDITGGGWDTAAEVTAGLMLASGDDIQIMVNGARADRWIGNMNDTDTKVWFNLNLSPKQEAPLRYAIDGTDPVYAIYFEPNPTNLIFLQAMGRAFNPTVIIDDECFTFDFVDTTNYRLISGQDMRSKKNTVIAAHSAGTLCKWVEHDIWLNYGDLDAVAPVQDDTRRPSFDLGLSTNTSWNYTNADCVDWWNPRAAKFQILGYQYPDYAIPNKTHAYTLDLSTWHGETVGDRLGIVYESKNWWQDISWYQQVVFNIFHPAGFVNAYYGGRKRNPTGFAPVWPSVVSRKSMDGLAWTDLTSETAPTPTSYVDIGPHDIDLLASYPYFQLFIGGQITSSTANVLTYYIEFYDMVMDIDSAGVPTVGTQSANSDVPIMAKITNNTTGEYILVNTICKLDEAIIVDCESRKAYYEKDGTNRLPAISWSPGRANDDWFNCPPGENEWQYDDVGMDAVTVLITHRDRMI